MLLQDMQTNSVQSQLMLLQDILPYMYAYTTIYPRLDYKNWKIALETMASLRHLRPIQDRHQTTETSTRPTQDQPQTTETSTRPTQDQLQTT